MPKSKHGRFKNAAQVKRPVEASNPTGEINSLTAETTIQPVIVKQVRTTPAAAGKNQPVIRRELVTAELRRIGLLTAVIVVILVVLAQVMT